MDRSSNRNNMADARTNYFIVSSIFVAFSVAFVFSQWLGNTKERYMMSDFGLYLYIALLLSASIVSVCHSMRRRENRPSMIRPSDAQAQDCRKAIVSGVAKGGLVVFMVGTLLYDSIWLVGTFDCIKSFMVVQCRVKEQFMQLIYLTLKLIFLGAQTMFLLRESDVLAKYGRSNTQRVVYAINTIANFTIIIYTVLYESKLATSPDSYASESNPCIIEVISPNITVNLHHIHACLNATTAILNVATGLEVYMYTYHSEFCILATSLNLMLWNASTSGEGDADPPSAGDDAVPDERTVKFTGLGRERSPKQGDGKNDDDDAESSPMLANNANWETEEELFLTADYSGGQGQIATRINTRYGAMSSESTLFSDDDIQEESPTEGTWLSTIKGCFASFRECRRCDQCLEPNPTQIHGLQNGCGCVSFCGFGLIMACTILTILQHIDKDGSHNLDTPLYLVSMVEFAAMTVASILLAIVSTKKLNTGPSIPRKFSVGSIVIMFSALLMQTFNFICIIAAINLLRQRFNLPKREVYRCISDIVEVAFDCVHIAMQTRLVLNIGWIMKRNMSRDAKFSSTMMQCVAFLMVGNFSKWILGTVIEIQDPGVNSSEILLRARGLARRGLFILPLRHLLPFPLLHGSRGVHALEAGGSEERWQENPIPEQHRDVYLLLIRQMLTYLIQRLRTSEMLRGRHPSLGWTSHLASIRWQD